MANNSIKVSDQLELWSDLEGKVVLITGASSGLGWDFTINLAEIGCKVIAAARLVDRLKSLCNLINRSSSSSTPVAVPLELDLTADPPVIEAALQKAWTAFGHIDVLINNAGFRGSRMRDTGIEGSIINISSVYGLNRGATTNTVAYSSSKAALQQFTTVMSLEFASYNIRVNAIAPSIFRSEITERLYQQKWIQRVSTKIVPLPLYYDARTDPSLTELIRYLIQDSSKYVSGNIFVVDGGHTLTGVPIWSSL